MSLVVVVELSVISGVVAGTPFNVDVEVIVTVEFVLRTVVLSTTRKPSLPVILSLLAVGVVVVAETVGL